MISNEKNPYDGVFKIQLAQFGEKYSFLIDTGSDICYLNEKFVEKEILPISTKIRYRKSILSTRAEGLYENLEFYPNNPSIVAFWQNPMKDNTISYAVLHNFDFIVDFHKKKLYVREVIRSDGLLGDDNDMITYFNRKGSGLSPTFGFSLRESGTRRFVLDRFSDNTKKRYVPQLKFNDELISVNGITLDKIDWTIWYQLDEADFVFRRKGKDFALHLKRQGIEGL